METEGLRAVHDRRIGMNDMSMIANGIDRLHDTYCRLTHLEVPLSLNRIYAWEAWCLEFNPPDLEIVVRHIERKVKDRGRLYRCFKFEWFIGDRESFAEDLAEAKALARAWNQKPNREQALRATGRRTEPPEVVHTAGEILASQEALKKLVALRDELLSGHNL